MMKQLLFVLFMILSLPLYADSYDILIEQGLDSMDREDYSLAIAYFSEALLLQPQKHQAQSYLELARKLKEMQEIDAVEVMYQFLEDKEAQEETQEVQEEVDPEIQEDFIFQQEQKDLARQDRPVYNLLLSIPFHYPSEGDGLSSSRQGELLYGGYEIQAGFYPQWFNSIMGVGLSSERKLFFQETNVFSVSQMNLNFLFRNFIAEELGARFIIGTQVGVGFTVIDEFSGQERATEPSWQVGILFSEPLFYHLTGSRSLKPLLFVGNVSFRYSENMNGLDGDLGLVYQMERFEIGLSWDYSYQFIYQGEEFQDWNLRFLIGQNL